jgi:hypothetical protein
VAGVRRCLVVGLLTALLLSSVSRAQNGSTTPELLVMLAQVPLDAASSQSGWAAVRFVDYEALFCSEGVSLIRALGDVSLLVDTVPLGGILSRIAAGPEALNYLYTSTGQMADVVGFEWLLHVDRSLEFGDLPSVGLLLGGDFDDTAIGTALQGRGFTLADVNGVPVWHRFEDWAISFAARDVTDPFGGHLGAAARIALLPNTVANARSWPLIEVIISAAQGIQPSLADDPGYRALADVISQPDGLLIQALFFTGTALRFPGNPTQAEPEPAVDLAPLPAFSLAVLADRQEGNDQVHLIGLVCADLPTAQTAAQVLARRVEAFHLPDRPEEVLVKQFGATVNVLVVERLQDNLAIAVVEVRYPLPSPRTDPQTGRFNAGGLLYRAWVRAIMRREFTPLW